MSNPSEQIRHLLNRTHFGWPFAKWDASRNMSRDDLLRQIFEESDSPNPLEVVPRQSYSGMGSDPETMSAGKGAPELRKQLITAWLNQMASARGALREKMTLFWHGHFACKLKSPFPLQQLNNVLRENALGHFGDLVKAVSRTPAMLLFLDNSANRKGHPNENFAREIMELFTLGEGHYTERDVQEAARAFTGWFFNIETAEFHFDESEHDFGEKEILGKKGNFNGDEVIDLLLAQPACAEFIVKKILHAFVHPDPPVEKIQKFARGFRRDWSIRNLMWEIFNSDWFYDAENFGALIKSPIELVAGTLGHLQARIESPDRILRLLLNMGQVPFDPPSVGGWKGGKTWIDVHSLPTRLAAVPEIMGYRVNLTTGADRSKRVSTAEPLGYPSSVFDPGKIFKETNLEKQFGESVFGEWLLPPGTAPGIAAEVAEWISGSEGEERVIQAFYYFMSHPSYQLM